MPAGGVAVAVFAIVAGAAWSTVPMTENTTCPPILTSTSWSIEPVPAKLPQRPSTAEQVHETRSSWAETASRTRAPATSSGPLFVTVTVKASLLPGTNVELETVFVTTRSALAVMSVVTVEVLFVELGSGVVDVTAAALTTEVPPRLAVPTHFHCRGAAHEAGARARDDVRRRRQDHPVPLAETYVIATGRVSITFTSCAVSGPLFVTVSVYAICSPVVRRAADAIFTSERSAFGAGGCGCGGVGAVTSTVALASLLAAFVSAVTLVTEAGTVA